MVYSCLKLTGKQAIKECQLGSVLGGATWNVLGGHKGSDMGASYQTLDLWLGSLFGDVSRITPTVSYRNC